MTEGLPYFVISVEQVSLNYIKTLKISNIWVKLLIIGLIHFFIYMYSSVIFICDTKFAAL